MRAAPHAAIRAPKSHMWVYPARAWVKSVIVLPLYIQVCIAKRLYRTMKRSNFQVRTTRKASSTVPSRRIRSRFELAYLIWFLRPGQGKFLCSFAGCSLSRIFWIGSIGIMQNRHYNTVWQGRRSQLTMQSESERLNACRFCNQTNPDHKGPDCPKLRLKPCLLCKQHRSFDSLISMSAQDLHQTLAEWQKCTTRCRR